MTSPQIPWNCCLCDRDIGNTQGFLYIDPPLVNVYRESLEKWRSQHPTSYTLAELETMPESPRWQALHDECAECASGYFIAVERVRTEAQLLDWTAHLMEKDWFASTRWDLVIRAALRRLGRSMDA